jgi:hypothetical protein
MLGLLLLAHFVCDYPLQGDFLARAKNPANPVAGVPWTQAMLAHCAIHAGGVYLATGSWGLALAELVAHGLIDTAKCMGMLGRSGEYTADRLVWDGHAADRRAFHIDHLLHLACKVWWFLLHRA